MDELLKLLGLSGGFATLGAIAALIMVIEELIDRVWNLDGVFSQIRTIIIGLILGVAGAYLDLGMFADPECCIGISDLWCGLAIGFAAAVGSNVVFLTPLAKAILEILKIRPKENGTSRTAPIESDAARRPE